MQEGKKKYLGSSVSFMNLPRFRLKKSEDLGRKVLQVERFEQTFRHRETLEQADVGDYIAHYPIFDPLH